jgi:hypothetical protein
MSFLGAGAQTPRHPSRLLAPVLLSHPAKPQVSQFSGDAPLLYVPPIDLEQFEQDVPSGDAPAGPWGGGGEWGAAVGVV